jgi:hypothetical protein
LAGLTIDPTLTMVVTRIDDQGDRLFLYGDMPHYHVIADPVYRVKVGDVVTYEPYGMNFGWCIAVHDEEPLMPIMMRVYDDPSRLNLHSDGEHFYLTLGHEVYTALHLSGGLQYPPHDAADLRRQLVRLQERSR